VKKSLVLLGSLILTFILYAVVAHIQNKATNEDLEQITGGNHKEDSELEQLTPPPNTDAPLLELQSWNWREEYGYAVVEGSVKNISGVNLKDVEAEVSFLSKDGAFISSTDGLTDHNPILPNQSSHFKAFTTYDTSMKKTSLQFRSLMGETLPWKEKEGTAKKQQTMNE
jgi:hypothetical protein